METSINLAEAAPIVMLLNALGRAVKAVPWIPDYSIPFVLMAAGALAQAGWHGWTPEQIIIGAGLGSAAVGMNQSFRQGREFFNNEHTPPPPTPPVSRPVV
jgi:hypothetical protein